MIIKTNINEQDEIYYNTDNESNKREKIVLENYSNLLTLVLKCAISFQYVYLAALWSVLMQVACYHH